MPRRMLELGGASAFVKAGKRFPAIASDRIFQNWCVWSKVPDVDGKGRPGYVLCFVPIWEHPDAEAVAAFRRDTDAGAFTEGETRGIWMIRSLAENLCHATLVQTADFKGSMAAQVMDWKIGRAHV